MKHKARKPPNRRCRDLRRLYGPKMTAARYAKMWKEQDGLCAICHRPETAVMRHGIVQSLAVDHDHETGEVRRLLCQRCNTGLGLFGDDPERLMDAAKYLMRARR